MTFREFFGGSLRHTGNAWIFGNDVSTDEMHPASYFRETYHEEDRKVVRSGLFKGLDETLLNKIQPGDIIVGGWNFGCGSSREAYPVALYDNGIAAVVTQKPAYIFWRNLANNGILVLEDQEFTGGPFCFEKNNHGKKYYSAGRMTIDLVQGMIYDDSGVAYAIARLPDKTMISLLKDQSIAKADHK